MRILSLFDGISTAQQALKELVGADFTYYASEIDKYCIYVTQRNHPLTIQIGDVRGLEAFDDIDIIVGGSPCQDLSIAKKGREGLNGKQSWLFWEYVHMLNITKPRFFIFENVASMSAIDRVMITEALEVEPIMLNAGLVSAQQRRRLFWIGKRFGDTYCQFKIPQPEDRKIYVKDIWDMDDGGEIKRQVNLEISHIPQDKPVNVLMLGKGSQDQRVYSIYGKTACLRCSGTTPFYFNGNYYRRLTAVECERLQSLPDGYTSGLSKTRRKKILGNGFNCSIIKHIFSYILEV